MPSSACAASIVTPGFRRATTSKARMARSAGTSGKRGDSVQISAGRENCTLSATTPTTVYGLAVQPHETADNRGIAAESAAPHGFTEQHHARRRAVVFGLERAADNRSHLEDVEEIGADALTLRRFDRAVRRGQQRPAAHAALDVGDALERAALQAPVAHVQRRDAGLGRRGRALPQHHQPFGLAKRQRPHQRRIGEREDGAVDADAERQGERRHQREPRSRDQLPHCQAHVTAHFFDPLSEPHGGVPCFATCTRQGRPGRESRDRTESVC